MINIIKYISLSLVLLNAPSIALSAFGSSMGSLFSVLTFGMPILYAILVKRITFLVIFLAIGLSYFLVSGIQFFRGVESEYFAYFIKFLIIVVLGGEIVKNTSKKELLWILMIGASSIVLNAVFFSNDYGRYSGFYIDPNVAGFICISGYGLTYGLDRGKLKLLGQFLFTFAGFLTFSRTFILLWLLVNLISLKLNPKNIKILLTGAAVIILLISFSAVLRLNTTRFNQLKALVSNEKVSTQELNEDSRTDTWAAFYPYVIDKPIFGNGFGAFQGGGVHRIGSHNSYLLIIGEAGIFAFLIFVGVQIYMIYYGVVLLHTKPIILMMGLGIAIFLLTNHNYFITYYIILVSMWVVTQIKQTLNEN